MELIDEIRSVLDSARKQYPYKVPGDYGTYDPYNEGWQDALDYVGGFFDQYLEWDEVLEDTK